MSFDLVAPHYRWMERLFAGEKLQRSRTALLGRLSPPQRVLIYGEGNGRFLADFLRRFPNSECTVVDASARMLSLAQQRLQRLGVDATRVRFLHEDALAWEPPPETFDLIVTCFFLDCFDAAQLRRFIPRVAAAASSSARWLVADFQIAPSGWRQVRSRFVVALLYAFFRRTAQVRAHQLVDPAPLLQAAGFERHTHVEHDHALLYSSLWSRRGGGSRMT